MVMWPKQTPAELNSFYGNPDANGDGAADPKWVADNLTTIVPRYQMYYGKVPITRITCHRKISAPLLAAFEGILDLYGSQAEIEAHGMHHYSGCFNFRPKRGGGTLSLHAYGAAIDLDAEHNPFRSKLFSMPLAVIKIFTDLGADAGAHWNPPDAMHFQFARVHG